MCAHIASDVAPASGVPTLRSASGRALPIFGRISAVALAFSVLGAGATGVLADDNPFGLIDPHQISVGTMGDAKPYAFSTEIGRAHV